MKGLSVEAQRAAASLGMSDDDYLMWWTSDRAEPAPYGSFVEGSGAEMRLTRAMAIVTDKEGHHVLMEEEGKFLLTLKETLH